MKNPFRTVRTFWAEMLSELRKAAWPSWGELKRSTLIVLLAIVLFGFYVSIVDFSLFQLVGLFTDWVAGSSAL